MTQSAVSQAIHHLENRLGFTLIDRSHRPWKLTAEGKVFYDGCKEVTDRYFDLEHQVKSLHHTITSTVRISCIYSVGLRHMREFSQDFMKTHGSTKIQLEFLHPDKVYESILEETADLGIVSFASSSRFINFIPWRFEQMSLACHPTHRLSRHSRVQPSDLVGEKFVGFDRGLVIRKEIDHFLKENNITVDTILEFDNIESIKRAVEINSGISILPYPTLDQEVNTLTLARVRLWDDHFKRPLGIIYRRGRKFHQGLQEVVDLLCENINV